jgi:hypothetical protein
MPLADDVTWSISQSVAIGWEVGRPKMTGEYSWHNSGTPEIVIANAIKNTNILTTSYIPPFQKVEISI